MTHPATIHAFTAFPLFMAVMLIVTTRQSIRFFGGAA